MINNLNVKHFWLIGGWFLVNLLQAAFTGLHSDESYYWMYSQNLDWGFFDHPPMTALLIYAANAFVPGELGVRLLLVTLSTFTFALILNELNEQKDILFVSVFILSFPLIHTHIAGFMAIPDIPFLFFTMLFLIFYKKFLIKPSAPLAIGLALVVAAMIYSKYHALLIVCLTVLSNLKLLRSNYFWLIVLFTLVLLIPHAWWQYENGFPTIRYHLIERAKPLRIKHITDYFLNQMLMAGPLTGILIFLKLFRYKIENEFNKALIFNIIGFYIVFFLLSFKNRIEAHWTSAIIPMLMFSTFSLIKNDILMKKWFKGLAIPVIFLMMLYRFYIAADFIPNIGHSKITFYNREASALEIKQLAEGKKVGFYNNYAAISNYIFYTRDSAVHFSTPEYRYCQYDLWNDEQFAHGEPVYAIQSKHMNPPNLRRMITGEMKGALVIEEFQPLNELTINHNVMKQPNGDYLFSIILENSTNHNIMTNHISEPVLELVQNNSIVTTIPLSSSDKFVIGPQEKAILSFLVPSGTINPNFPLALYTRSKEKIRGELLVIKADHVSAQK